MDITGGKNPLPLKGLIYGPEGVGKSSLAAQFPNPVFIDVEGGTNRLDVQRTPRPLTWAHFLQILRELAADQQGKKTMVIDTADWLENLAIRQVCATNGTKSLGGNNDYGTSYQQLAMLWSDLLTQLETDFIQTKKMHVVFLAHSITKKMELPEEEGAFDRYQLPLDKRVGPSLMGWCDMMLFVNYKTVVEIDEKTKKATAQGGVNRVMYTQHTAAFDAKNRDDLPAEMQLDAKKLAVCFPPIEVQVPTKSATPENPTTTTTSTPDKNKKEKPQHAQLRAMMAESGVTYDQLLAVLVERGRYPEKTPIENIDPSFIDGWINQYWDKALEMIRAKN